VAGWPTPTVAGRPARPRPVGVPEWWDDDEEASQGFLAAMGVQLD
jgi:hypothetical protein